jgi:hypothetical protein
VRDTLDEIEFRNGEISGPMSVFGSATDLTASTS